ncbi:MAG: hypothetical protein FKGGLIKP_00731 [Sodalis sp. Fse]|nr:MAG: hypothetical protein FKGGLIKP_00731 [Sodalis sp. Fse]
MGPAPEPPAIHATGQLRVASSTPISIGRLVLLVLSSPYYEALVQAAWYVTANGKATFSNMFTANKQSIRLENMLIFCALRTTGGVIKWLCRYWMFHNSDDFTTRKQHTNIIKNNMIATVKT